MNKKIIIGIVCVVVIAIVCIGVYAFKTQIKNTSSVTKEPEEEVNVGDANTKVDSNGKKSLVVYFSLPEKTGDAKEDSTVDVDGKTMGNTEYVANLIKDYTGADIYRIEPVKEYNTKDHQALINDAKEEQENDARPEIKTKISNFDEYDIIYVGYPIWWSDLPQIMYTFFELYDFSDKTVIPFSTNGGSGLAGTVSTIKNKLTTATVEENAFALYRENMETAPEKVESWLKELGAVEQ